MKLTKRLGLFLALAFLVTACGSAEESQQQGDGLPEQVMQLPEQETPHKEAEQTGQEPEKQPADQKEDDTKSNEQDTAKEPGQQKAAESNAGKPNAQPGTNPAAPAKAPSSNGKTGSGTGSGSGSGSGTSGAAKPSQPATPPKQSPTGSFNMFVTHNFGGASVFNQNTPYYKGDSLMDVMHDNLEVTTKYGGGFVNSINGVASGYTDKSIFTRKKRDWFYFVNGAVAGVGADAYSPQNGDSVWWDYHDWSGSGSNTPSVVGSYPHPFTVGYNGARPGTVIYYSGKHADDANRLASALRGLGAGNVRTSEYSNQNLIENNTNVILLGTWPELQPESSVQDLFSSPTRTGIYATVEDGAVQLLDYTGDESGQSGQALIAATGTGNGDTTPTWLLIGVDEPALDAAVNTLVSSSGKLRGKIGVVLSNGAAVGVPVAP
ncbi:hypothetical protein CBW65_01105 [Tumebacillus avium]|uniref:Transcobalamin-like C-terminal domain-containing protein n=1 Tax=Tumebacillus avium TaxID=1903704 RepID=A0A1Y0IKC2_9BACL|nr:DUF4430 domain-containing protein [Tumebacillus avium]ARU59804.1 hypothetical protein CBW65_01105 [Tumebacillus avium]